MAEAGTARTGPPGALPSRERLTQVLPPSISHCGRRKPARIPSFHQMKLICLAPSSAMPLSEVAIVSELTFVLDEQYWSALHKGAAH